VRTIVGFCGGKWGEPGVGKTTAAGFLVERGFHLVSFSTPIEKIARTQCGWDGDRGKPGKDILDGVCRSGRQVTEDYWLNLAIKLIPKDAETLVFDDVYFLNEYHFIKSQGGFIVEILRPPVPKADLLFDPDGVVFNKGDLSNFQEAITLTLKGLGVALAGS